MPKEPGVGDRRVSRPAVERAQKTLLHAAGKIPLGRNAPRRGGRGGSVRYGAGTFWRKFWTATANDPGASNDGRCPAAGIPTPEPCAINGTIDWLWVGGINWSSSPQMTSVGTWIVDRYWGQIGPIGDSPQSTANGLRRGSSHHSPDLLDDWSSSLPRCGRNKTAHGLLDVQKLTGGPQPSDGRLSLFLRFRAVRRGASVGQYQTPKHFRMHVDPLQGDIAPEGMPHNDGRARHARRDRPMNALGESLQAVRDLPRLG